MDADHGATGWRRSRIGVRFRWSIDGKWRAGTLPHASPRFASIFNKGAEAMKYAKPIVIALLLWLCEPLTLFVPLLALFIKWDAEPSTDSHGGGLTIRGDLPGWTRKVWQTPDERCPGGTYEPTVAAFLAAHGRYWCSVYWLGWRNRLQGLAFQFSEPADRPWDPTLVYQEDGDLWFLRWPFRLFWYWPLQLKAGYRTYLINGKLYAVSCLTITKP